MNGKTLLVFGARHLGRKLAREPTAEGWNAAAVARSEETIASLREELPDDGYQDRYQTVRERA